jgi:hypothetical protein
MKRKKIGLSNCRLGRIGNGALAGLAGGIVASWAANQFHSLWSHLQGDEQHPEVTRLSQRGGRPDTAEAKEDAAGGKAPQEDATVRVASKVAAAVTDSPLSREEKHYGGVAVHYLFGAVGGAIYGAVAGVAPVVTMGRGLAYGAGVWLGAVELALPAAKLAKPAWKYPVRMHVYSFLSHLVYGAVTEGVRAQLQPLPQSRGRRQPLRKRAA